MSKERKQSTEVAVREIRRRTRRKFSPEEKTRIVLEGLRGEQSISELCRRGGIASNLYYRWSKDFLEAGLYLVSRTRTFGLPNLRDTFRRPALPSHQPPPTACFPAKSHDP